MNNNIELTIVAYADDIVLMAESEDKLRNTTSILLNEGKEIGLKINESKTKKRGIGWSIQGTYHCWVPEKHENKLAGTCVEVRGMIESITKWKPDTKRPRGHPRQRWVDRVQDLKLLNIGNAEECAKDKEEWKQYVVAAMDLKGLDGEVLFCKACNVKVSALKQFTIERHINREKHTRGVEQQKEEKPKPQLLLTDTSNTSKKLSFNLKLCQTLLLANILLNKLNNEHFRKFLEKYIKVDIPDESTLRKNYVELCYNDTMQKIRDYIGNKKIWASMDETTDVEGRYVVNVIIGTLELVNAGKILLLHTDVLEKANNSTIAKVFDKSMFILSPLGTLHGLKCFQYRTLKQTQLLKFFSAGGLQDLVNQRKLLLIKVINLKKNGKVERFHKTLKQSIRAYATSDWTTILPTVLFGLRCTLKDENVSPAYLVYGTSLRMPGEFFVNSSQPAPDTDTFVSQLQQKFELIRPVNTLHKTSRTTFISPELSKATHVFVRHDAVKKPLQMPYDGPFLVIHRTDKTYQVSINGKTVNISIDRLKPAFLPNEDSTRNDHSYAAFKCSTDIDQQIQRNKVPKKKKVSFKT
ncbi:hypothetical protein QTP88_025200 [Uroleucon formosanum]